jgi:thiol-disulfide isomerase/thioredoxin
MSKVKFILPVLAAIASLLIVSPQSHAKGFSCSTLAKNSMSAKPFSKISLPCIGTKTSISLAQIKGPALINVWGSWCYPCRQELPLLSKAYSSGKIPIIGVDVEESSPQRGTTFAASHKITWLNLYDPDSRTKTVFGFGVPVTWFIDAQGKVVLKHIGVYANYSDLQKDLIKQFGIRI